jgi:hypothetical protein
MKMGRKIVKKSKIEHQLSEKPNLIKRDKATTAEG